MRAPRLLALSLPLVCLVGTVLLVGPRTGAAEPRTRAALITPRTREAIDRGLRYLVRLQNDDGSWSCDAGKKVNDGYEVFPTGSNVHHVGVTALGVLAFLAAGHVPGRGPYGDVVDRAVEFLLESVTSDGYVAKNGTRMYSHAFATLALAEAYGTKRTPRLREQLQKAVYFTQQSQNPNGGWRYVPLTQESDMSVTVCQVVALRAARNHGIRVDQTRIDKALKYVIDSAITEDGMLGEEKGAFYYQPSTTRYNRSSFPLTAAGLTTLFQAGLYDDASVRYFVEKNNLPKSPPPSIDDCIAYMNRYYEPLAHGEFREHYFFYYGNYYATQAMYTWSSMKPSLWETWYTRLRDDLLEMEVQTPGPSGDGPGESHWHSNVGPSTDTFATSMALLMLSMPFDYLPIHQR